MKSNPDDDWDKEPLLSWPARWGCFATIAVGLVAVIAMWNGSYLIYDPDDAIDHVVEHSGSVQYRLFSLGFAHVGTVLVGEGELLVRCRNGAELSLGYVSMFSHIHLTIRQSDCWPANGTRVMPHL